MQLRDIAARSLITIAASDSVDKALSLMEEHGIHHLPVTNGRLPVGMVSDRDLLTNAGWMSRRDRTDHHDGTVLGPRTVDEVMTTPIKCLSPDDDVFTGARMLIDEKFSAIPLVRDDQLDGLVAESDLLKCFIDDRPLGHGAWRQAQVGHVMTANVISVRPKDVPLVASRLMRDKRIRHLPVVDNEHLVGIVSDRDVRKAMFREWLEQFHDDELEERERVHRTNIRDIMHRRVITATMQSTLAEVADKMLTDKIGALPVVDESRNILGVITETDLLQVLAAACMPT